MIHTKHITTAWFFSTPPKVFQMLGIYIKGDALVLVPTILVIVILLVISLKLGLLIASLFFAIRGLGEMIYWLLQQFGPKTYRPWDYGLTNLSNEGIYILYQLTSMVQVVTGIGILVYLLFF